MMSIRRLLCLIVILLVMIVEKGVPVRLEKGDWLIYGGFMLGLLLLTEDWSK